MSASILISVIAHNRLELTKRCVASVLVAAKSHPSAFVILHDNHSTDGVAEYFDGVADAGVEVIHHATNTGFQIPCEESFVRAVEHGHKYLCVVNNDATVPQDFLTRFVEELERHPAGAIVGCSGGCHTVSDELHGYSGASYEYVELACALIDVEKVSKHFDRLFDKRLYFAYGEDLDLSLRMQKLGYTIHRCNFSIEHARGSTSEMVPEAKIAQLENHEVLKKIWSHWVRHRTFSHRIIVRRTYSAGDVLLATPLIRRLWRDSPLCQIVVETKFHDLFLGNPCISAAAENVGRHQTDMVIDLDGSYEAAPMRPIVTSYARTAGVELESDKTEFHVSPRDAAWAELRLPVDEKWVAIHAGPSTWPGKNWPMDRWRKVVEFLNEQGMSTVLVGSQANQTLSDVARLDLCGKTTIPQLMAVLQRCALTVTIDSLPLHASQAVGTPIVALFGVTSPVYICTSGSRWRAVRSDRYHPDTGIRHRVFGQVMVNASDAVMRTISVEDVIDALTGALNPAKEVGA
jgi:ADP-heptose:LPS heptosyltransferase